MKNTNTDNPKLSSDCEIYRRMLMNPPKKQFRLCEEKINFALLNLTGEVLFEQECREISRLDKKSLENAEKACDKSLGNPNLLNKHDCNRSTQDSESTSPKTRP
jgi:hypothetical protein